MGTNYYWHEKPSCSECKRPFEPLHIGKSSAGWCFGLHVYLLDDGMESIPDLAAWQKLWARPGSEIRDEYSREVSAAEILDVITNRAREKKWSPDDAWYRDNYAVPGPGNLARHAIDGRHCCIGHGEGTWDLMVGEFS